MRVEFFIWRCIRPLFLFYSSPEKTMQIAFFEGAAREWESGTHPRSRADTTDSNETINTGACSIVGPTITLKSDSSKLSHNGQLKQPTSANFSAPLYATLRPTAHGAPPCPTTPHLCFILMPLCARFNRFAVFDLHAKRCFFITSLEVMFY